MKSFSCFVFLVLLTSTLAFAPPSMQKRPHSRISLCPEDAKDLEAVAGLAYEHLMKEAISTEEDSNNNTHHSYNDDHRQGPVAWCRRILFGAARDEEESTPTLSP